MSFQATSESCAQLDSRGFLPLLGFVLFSVNRNKGGELDKGKNSGIRST